jgi:ABC-type lipoprotein release transport system permease subunit
MAALWMAWRAEARTRWRAWLGLGLILGLAAGAAIACGAGARRTNSAYDRFLTATNAADISTGGAGDGVDIQAALAAIEKYPEVAEYARGLVVAGRVLFLRGGRTTTLTVPEVWALTEPPPTPGRSRIGVDIGRYKVVDGHMPRPGHDNEASISFILADRYGVGLGDKMILTLGNPFGDPQHDVTVRIVGVYAVAGEFQGIGTLTVPSVTVPYTFAARYPDWMPDPGDSQSNFTVLRLRRGRADYPSFIRRLTHESFGSIDIGRSWDHTVGVERTLRIHAFVLFASAIFLSLTGFAIFGQGISRQIALGSADQPTLRALGSTRRSLLGLGLARAVVPAFGAVVTAFLVALLGSPLFPLGAAGVAEPHPGIAVDGLAVGAGIAVVLLGSLIVALWPAIREARAAAIATDKATPHPSLAAAAAQRLSAPASILTGLRLALEPGKGRTAVPVRSTIGGITIAIAAIIGAVVLTGSLDHLLAHPDLAGQTYDAIVVPQTEEEPSAAERAALTKKAKEDLPFMKSVGLGTVTEGLVGNREMFGAVFAEHQPIGFAVIDGHAPTDSLDRGLSEIALGVKTMERLKIGIGDVATIALESHTDDNVSQELLVRGRVVGRVAIPSYPFGVNAQGEGFAMSLGTFNRFIPDEGGCCFALFKPGTDRDRALAEATRKGYQLFFSNQRADLNTLEELGRGPLLLAGFFGLVGIAVLAHTLVTAIRRRRRDLALLKTLGFLRAQARRAVAVQASTIAAIALLIGVPGGLVLGRWGWRFFAFSFGVQPVSVAPVWFLVVVIPAVLLFANLVAIFPGRTAARTQPALILRAE